MDIENIKPLVKLYETVVKGIGIVVNDIFKFDEKQIKRTGKARVEVIKNEIIAKAEGVAIAKIIKNETEGVLSERTQKRLLFMESKREINIEKTVLFAK